MSDSLRVQFIALGGLFAALLAVSALLAFFYREAGRTTTFVIPPDIMTCDDDKDCGIVNQIGCCPCEASGGQGAINKRMRPRLKTFLHRACGREIVCLNVSTCRDDLIPTCGADGCALITRDVAPIAERATPEQ